MRIRTDMLSAIGLEFARFLVQNGHFLVESGLKVAIKTCSWPQRHEHERIFGNQHDGN